MDSAKVQEILRLTPDGVFTLLSVGMTLLYAWFSNEYALKNPDCVAMQNPRAEGKVPS